MAVIVAKVFTKATQSPNRFWTRLRGGFTKAEMSIIALVIVLLAFFIGPFPVSISPISPPAAIYAPYLYGAVKAAWWTRKLPTDNRPFEEWLIDMLRYHLRKHPFRSTRRVAQKRFALPAAKKHVHVTTLLGGNQHVSDQSTGKQRASRRWVRSA